MENPYLLSVLIDLLRKTKQILQAEIFSLRVESHIEGIDHERISNEIAKKESRLAMVTEDAIKKYTRRWAATTPSDWLPCPFCYVFHKKDSHLEPLPEKHGIEFVKCSVCKEKFSIPMVQV